MRGQGLSWRYLHQPLHGLRLEVVPDEAQPGSGTEGEGCATFVRGIPAQARSDPGATPLKIQLLAEAPPTRECLWEKETRGGRYLSRLGLYRTEKGLLLKIDCEGSGSFEYRPDGIGIHWQREGTGAEHYFQSFGVALWLELQGIPCIHANALAVGKGAIGIIAPSRTGKTTLTAALLDAGLGLMTDDMLALHHAGGQWLVHPGWPQLRMWPDTARRFAGAGLHALPRVHERFDKRIVHLEAHDRFAFCSQSRPLERLYLLERRETTHGETETTDIPPGEALLHLLQNSMLADAYRPLGLEQQRLEKLAALLGDIPLTRIRYPSGMHHLSAVCQRILDAH